jgi:hypothetical protein
LDEQDVTSRLEDIRVVPALSSSSSSSSSSSPYHLLPLIQVRFKGSTMPLDGRLAGSLKHAQGTIIR